MSHEQKINLDFNSIIRDFDSLIGKTVRISGRIIAVRKLKLSAFFDLDQRGTILQVRTDAKYGDIPVGSIVEAEGVCALSTSGYRTVDEAKIEVITKWEHPQSFSDIQKLQQGPLHTFVRDIYSGIFFAQAARNYMRAHLQSEGFFEIQTPVLTKHYNGGRSIPVGISYLNSQIGYCRTTFEDRMQAYIAAGFERIFQIGSIFRSGKERTLLEGYATSLTFDEGKQFMKNIMTNIVSELQKHRVDEQPNATIDNIVSQNWTEVDFLNGAAFLLGIGKDHIADADSVMLNTLRQKGILEKDTTLEMLAEKIGFAIAKQSITPIIITHFPVWSSPLYKQVERNGVQVLLRGRMYFQTSAGLHRLEFGVQENDYQKFKQRNEIQKKAWDLPPDDERVRHSDLSEVIAGGVPPLFGFAIDPDWLLKIFGDEHSMDVYNEL